MGDRTHVTLTVLTEHVIHAKAMLEPQDGEPSEEYDDGVTTVLCFEEVNYGTLEALGQFQAAGIPYSSQWGSGGDYTEGEEHLRFTAEGTAVSTTSSKDWPYDTLVRLKEASRDCSTFDEMAQLLDQAIEAQCTPGWENQEENAKRYLAVQLITPKEEPQC